MSGRGAGAARLRRPLLDRLLERADEEEADAPGALKRQEGIEELRGAVRRDVEALLNARRRRLPPPAGLAELARSPVGYGLPDPTAGSFSQEEQRQALAREVEAAIRRFEPRLADVSVELVRPEAEGLDRALRLRVEGVLRAEPSPEPVSFETVVRPVTLDVSVREA